MHQLNGFFHGPARMEDVAHHGCRDGGHAGMNLRIGGSGQRGAPTGARDAQAVLVYISPGLIVARQADLERPVASIRGLKGQELPLRIVQVSANGGAQGRILERRNGASRLQLCRLDFLHDRFPVLGSQAAVEEDELPDWDRATLFDPLQVVVGLGEGLLELLHAPVERTVKSFDVTRGCVISAHILGRNTPDGEGIRPADRLVHLPRASLEPYLKHGVCLSGWG